MISWDDLLRPGLASDMFADAPAPRFDPSTGEYSIANAWWLAELSRAAYRHGLEENQAAPAPRRSDILERVGLRERVAVIADGATRAVIVTSETPTAYAVLVFRGTEQRLQDVLHDADTWPIALASSARVHRGFVRALDKVWPEIVRVLDEYACPCFYAGHSLGGALAVLAAARRPARAVYTYGAPRVGDARFGELLTATPVHRIVHGEDIVTEAPPEAMGFRHVGEAHRIGVVRNTWERFDPALLWAQLGAPAKPLADHAPVAYADALRALVKSG